MNLQPGDKVIKNPKTWIPTEFDAWGAGEGIGEVLEVLDDATVDVRWPTGRAYQNPTELLPADQWTSSN